MGISSTVNNGLKKGFTTTWELTKVMAPVYLGVTVLGQTPVMDWLARLANPFMALLGLPGNVTSLVLVRILGGFISGAALNWAWKGWL